MREKMMLLDDVFSLWENRVYVGRWEEFGMFVDVLRLAGGGSYEYSGGEKWNQERDYQSGSKGFG